MTAQDRRNIQDTISSLNLTGAAADLVRLTCEQLYSRGVTDGLKQGEDIFMNLLLKKKNKKGLSK